jgi:hypothetical protein
MPRIDHLAATPACASQKRSARRSSVSSTLRAFPSEHDHGIATGLFFRDPDGRQLEAITYKSGDDPRRP